MATACARWSTLDGVRSVEYARWSALGGVRSITERGLYCCPSSRADRVDRELLLLSAAREMGRPCG